LERFLENNIVNGEKKEKSQDCFPILGKELMRNTEGNLEITFVF
jgi:hypothetical protein